MKLGRKYTLKAEVAGGGNVTVELPFSVDFTVKREALASAQTATFVLYNLAEKTRNQLYKDRFNVTEFRAVQFMAGYDTAPMIFNGIILQAYSYRQGRDFLTVIDCYDGGYGMANSFSSVTIGSGASFSEIIKRLNGDLLGVTAQPIVGNFGTKTGRGSVYLGNTWNYILQLSNGLATIDNGQLKALNQNEVIQAEIPVITSESGLLGSPKRANTMIEQTLLFEPRVTLGQLVQLRSVTNTIFNGAYKVAGFTHHGTISPVVSGDALTDLSLWKGTEAFLTVPGVPVQ